MAEWEKMKQMTLIEMDGFLKGKCIPCDLKVNETNAEYLVRKFAEAEAKFAALAAENAWLKSETPLGAIENGRAFADRLENYQFECEGGNLNMCSDWQEFRRCFEYLSEWAMHSQKEHPANDAFLSELRAQGVEMFGQYHNFSEKLFIQKEAQKFAAQLRKGGSQ
ncbi:TPA: hypothetical protein J9297_003875 [Escherichia coli]|nr:hypothetical protein [Escherichia coli]